MRPVTLITEDASGEAVFSPPCPLDLYIAPFNVTLATSVSDPATYTVEYTLDDVYAEGYDPDTGTWFPVDDMTTAATPATATLISPVTAVRLVQNDGAGSVTLKVIQAGVQ